MSWILLSGINVLSISVGALFQRLAMKKQESDPIASSIIFQFILAGMTFLFALTQGYTAPPMAYIPYYLISGALYSVGTIAFFHAYKHIGASEVAVLAGTGVIATILASFLFLHDRLTMMQLVGVLGILSAIVIIHYSKEILRFNAGSWFTLLGTGAYGLAVVSDTYIVRHYDAVSYLPFICLLPGIFIALFYIRRTPTVLREIRNVDRNLIIFTLLYALQAITFYLALKYGALVSQISTISRASIILTVIFATLFLKETRHMTRKIIAAIVTTVGVVLVTGRI